jgi:hypothetical protein
VAGDRLLGLHFLPPGLIESVYHHVLRYVVPDLFQDVGLQTRITLWFTHNNGAPLDHFLAVRELLNNVLPEQWIGQGGPAAWPAHSSHLNPLVFISVEK